MTSFASTPLALLFAGLVVVGSAGCSNRGSETDDSDYDYDGDDMRAAIEGTWTGDLETNGASTSTPLTLKLSYLAPDSVQPACGNRQLSGEVAVAPRCVDLSSINVTGTADGIADEGGGSTGITLLGTFTVMSLKFDGRGFLDGKVGGGRSFTANLADGTLTGNVSSADGSLAQFTLHR